MRGVWRFLSWFLLVPYFAVQLIPSRPWFSGVSQEYHDRLQGQLVVSVIVLLLSAPWWGVVHTFGRSLAYDYSFAVVVWLFVFVIVGRLLNSLGERGYPAEFKSMPRWKRCAFGLSTLTLVVTAIALMPGGRRSLAPAWTTHLHCNDAATEMTADDCSAQ